MRLVNLDDFAVRELQVSRSQLMFVQHILEASEGLGLMIAPKGKCPIMIAPLSQEAALDTLLRDLATEIELKSRPLSQSELADVGA